MLEDWLSVARSVPLPHVLVVFAILGVPLLMVEMGYSHYRGNFHRWPMYIPVAFPPLFAVAGFMLLATGAAWAWWLFGAASVGLLAMGVMGWFFHLQGIARQTGGFNLDNVMVGPPFGAPLGFAAVAALGLVALVYWGAPA